MYSDEVKISNRIITDKDLNNIFYKIWEVAEEHKKIYKKEKLQNERLNINQKRWTFIDYSETYKFNIDFYDGTSITIDDYSLFTGIFNKRLNEIKSLWVNFSCSYFKKQDDEDKYISEHINFYINESKMDIDVEINNDDKRLNDIYLYIKDVINRAKDKYDRTISKRKTIKTKITFAVGAIPSIVVVSLFGLVPGIRNVYINSYILYPFTVIFFGFIFGEIFYGGKLADLYNNLLPEKKYEGYDEKNYRNIYKDDIDSYTGCSEIIIGKNANNIKKRKEINFLEKKYSSFIGYELGIIFFLSIFIILIGKII